MRYSILLLLVLTTIACNTKTEKKLQLYVGSYTEKLGHVDGKSKGIAMCSFDPETGKLTNNGIKAEIQNPSYITLGHSGEYLYSVVEKGSDGEFDYGDVVAFQRNLETGTLKKINEASTGGKYPCYTSLSSDNNYLFTANYVGGLSMHIIHGGGRLSYQFFNRKIEGKGAHHRQDASHMHMIQQFDNSVWVSDLGTDKIFVFNIETKENELRLAQEINLPSGSGPRHMAFLKDKDFIYVVNELNATINLITRNSEKVWSVTNTYHTLSNKATDGACGDIHIGKNNKYLYVSNRGKHNSISVFQIETLTGALKLVQEISSAGKTPRNFVISPNGKHLLVANQDSSDITVFEIDETSGKLAQTSRLKVATPVCLKFAPAQATL